MPQMDSGPTTESEKPPPKDDLVRVIWVAALVGLAGFGLWTLASKLFGTKVREESTSVVLKLERSKALVTGYAYVSALWLKSKNGKHIVEDWFFTEEGVVKGKQSAIQFEQKDVTGMCHRLYHVAFGYADTQVAVDSFESSKASPPLLLAIEAVKTANRGTMEAIECDGFDAVVVKEPDRREKVIKRRMVLDDLLETHYEQGCRTLATFSGRSDEKVAQERLTSCLQSGKAQAEKDQAAAYEQISAFMTKPEPQATGKAPALNWLNLVQHKVLFPHGWARGEGEAAGALGGVAVTLSTIGSISYERGWLWKSEEFYVRRDKTVATFGAPIKSVTHRKSAEGKTLLVVAESPTIVSRDRRVEYLFATDNFKESKVFKGDEDGVSHMERVVLRSVDWALKDIEPQAKRLARLYMRANLQGFAEARNEILDLKIE